jgi:hypothetical protein
MVLACSLTIDGKEDAALVLLPNAIYLLPDATLANVLSELVWCRSCDDFRAGESIDSRESTELQLCEMDSILAQEADVWPEMYRFIYNGNREQLASYRDTLKRTLHWMDFRKSPPRCLSCGGIDVEPVSHDSFVDGRGRVVNSISHVFASTSIDHELSLYDPDGNHLGEISRICPDTSDFIDDAYDYHRIVEMLKAEQAGK